MPDTTSIPVRNGRLCDRLRRLFVTLLLTQRFVAASVLASVAGLIFFTSITLQKEEELLESEKSKKPVHVNYKLPDGNIIEVGMERFQAPEVLFNPELSGEEYPGIHETLTNSIQKVHTSFPFLGEPTI